MSSTETTVNTDPEQFFAHRTDDATVEYADVTVFIEQTADDEFEILVYPNADTPAADAGHDPDRHRVEAVFVNTCEVFVAPNDTLVLDADVTFGAYSANLPEDTDHQRAPFPGDLACVYC